MANSYKDSNFRTQLDEEKVYKNNIKLYVVVTSIIIPLFGVSLYLSQYPIWFVYTIFIFFIGILTVLLLTTVSKYVRIHMRTITTILLFLAVSSFAICLYATNYDREIALCFLVSFVLIIMTLNEPKQILFFSLGILMILITGALMVQPDYHIVILLISIMFFGTSMSYLLSKRNERIISGLSKEALFMSEILNNTGIGYILMETDLQTITDCNDEAIRMFGNAKREIEPDLMNEIIKNFGQDATSKVINFDFYYNDLIIEFKVRKVNIQNKRIQYLFKFFDVTDKKSKQLNILQQKDFLLNQTQQKLQNEILKLQSIYKHSPEFFIWNINKDLEIISFNEYFRKQLLSSIDREVKVGMTFDELYHNRISDNGAENFKKKLKSVFKTKKTDTIEGKLYNLKEEFTWFETFMTPIFNQNNEVTELVCISHNTTEKNNYEEEMKKMLKEQVTLLQEVHHRVKNNLQVISSILNLQAGYVTDEKTLTILQESQNRIKSMSYIHESLYMNNDFSSINFKEYILNLTNNLVHSYHIFETPVEIVNEIAEMELGLDQSIPCGLIVNEIISNALKHAFIGRKNENKRIKIAAFEEEQKVIISIEDNGVGLPKNFEPEKSDSLGMQLIYTLIEQLEGNIDMSSEGGTKYLITFEKQNK